MSSVNPFTIARILQTVYAKFEVEGALITREEVRLAEELKGNAADCM